MAAQVGDRIIVESQRTAARPGRARSSRLSGRPLGARYRVRWEDGQESTIRPATSSARTTPPAERHQVAEKNMERAADEQSSRNWRRQGPASASTRPIPVAIDIRSARPGYRGVSGVPPIGTFQPISSQPR
jgi:hypothetical protein